MCVVVWCVGVWWMVCDDVKSVFVVRGYPFDRLVFCGLIIVDVCLLFVLWCRGSWVLVCCLLLVVRCLLVVVGLCRVVVCGWLLVVISWLMFI